MKIFFSAGEPSGDLHAANLMRALRARLPGAEFVGYGGPEMAEAGCQLHADLTALAVMWFLRAMLNLHKFLALVGRADRYFRHVRPDAVVLVDYPGFNWWIARRAKAHGIPVFYYAPPQIWAWASWRVKKMRRYVDHVLCSLPFEETWFRQHGCNATFVGHPYFDEVRRQELDQAFLDHQMARGGRLVTILPGSRTQEVEHNLRWFLRAAARVHEAVPDTRFAVASFKPHQAELARRMIKSSGLPAEVFLRRTPELIELAECCMAVSGSVSLELLHHTRPTVVLYWINRIAYFVQSWFRKVKYITLVNLLTSDELFPDDVTPYDPKQPGAERVLFPEYLTCKDRSHQVAEHVIEWLMDEDRRRRTVAELVKLKVRVGHGGASRMAADYMLKVLSGGKRPVPRPHFLPGMAVKSSGGHRRLAMARLLAFTVLAIAAPGRVVAQAEERSGEVRFRPTAEEPQVPELFRLPAHTFAFRQVPQTTVAKSYDVFEVTFPSPVETPHSNNNTVHCEYFRPHGSGKHPAVIVLHILGGDFNLSRLFSRQLAADGVAALFLKLPYYGPRRQPGEKARMISENPRETVAGMRQGILDIRRGVAWLAAQHEVDADRLGVFGISLGGITSALAVSIEPRLASACLMLAGGDVARVAWDDPKMARLRERWLADGGTKEEFFDLWKKIDPVTYAERARGKPILMLNAAHDEIIPRACTESLWHALGEPEIVWYEAGHISAIRYLLDGLGRVSRFFAEPGAHRNPR